jgi:ribonuclease PH
MPRPQDRGPDQLREIAIQRHYLGATPGSVLISSGQTIVLCTASVESRVPPWLEGKGKGWVTAEYSMLPGSTSPRKPRDRGTKIDGRTTEIQRLIGRSLRAIVDLSALGEQMITVDCDVLQADGGTRTIGITGAFIALVDAIASIPELPDQQKSPFRDTVAAISVGIVNGDPVLDLEYIEDVSAAVDMNVVMTGKGQFVELQGTGEEATFSDDELTQLIHLARMGIDRLTASQREALGTDWPLP